jgi:hypothetical protein
LTLALPVAAPLEVATYDSTDVLQSAWHSSFPHIAFLQEFIQEADSSTFFTGTPLSPFQHRRTNPSFLTRRGRILSTHEQGWTSPTDFGDTLGKKARPSSKTWAFGGPTFGNLRRGSPEAFSSFVSEKSGKLVGRFGRIVSALLALRVVVFY